MIVLESNPTFFAFQETSFKSCGSTIWMFPKIGGFTPKSSILTGVFHYFYHPFRGTPILGNTHIRRLCFSCFRPSQLCWRPGWAPSCLKQSKRQPLRSMEPEGSRQREEEVDEWIWYSGWLNHINQMWVWVSNWRVRLGKVTSYDFGTLFGTTSLVHSVVIQAKFLSRVSSTQA